MCSCICSQQPILQATLVQRSTCSLQVIQINVVKVGKHSMSCSVLYGYIVQMVILPFKLVESSSTMHSSLFPLNHV
jgi:hypothetical protein